MTQPFADLAWMLGGALPALLVVMLTLAASRRVHAGARDGWSTAGGPLLAGLAPPDPLGVTDPAEEGSPCEEADGIRLLFDGRALLDASPAGLEALRASREAGVHISDWDLALRALERMVPGAARALCRHLPDRGLVLRHRGATGDRVLRARRLHGMTFVTLDPAGEADETITLTRDSHAAAEQELRFLRQIVALDPTPTWAEGNGGEIIWANPAYLACCPGYEAGTWPPPAIFPSPTEDPAHAAISDGQPQRAVLVQDGRDLCEYDVYRRPRTEGTLCHALPAHMADGTRSSLNPVTRTLAKTFARLPTGLAIFDADAQRLILFNPMLAELTRLDPAWLSSRPRLDQILDRLRERQFIPEPRDYRAWRKKFLEDPAGYDADWPLPNGQTYRVSCRADDDGALALVLQDISAEMGTIRGFRADLETHEALLNLCGEALAVFSRGGTLVLTNPSYEDLWNVAPGAVLADTDILEASRIWAQACDPSPVWAEIRDFVASLEERGAWSASLRHRQGFEVKLRVNPMPGGATLVGFQWAAEAMPGAPALVPKSAALG